MPSKSGRHHNRNGLRQIKKGSLARNTKRLAKRLGIPYRNPTKYVPDVASAASAEPLYGLESVPAVESDTQPRDVVPPCCKR